jgi:hypothetical protein
MQNHEPPAALSVSENGKGRYQQTIRVGRHTLIQMPDVSHTGRVISLEGELTTDQRNRLLEIANKCPMYRTLCSDIHIDSRIA